MRGAELGSTKKPDSMTLQLVGHSVGSRTIDRALFDSLVILFYDIPGATNG